MMMTSSSTAMSNKVGDSATTNAGGLGEIGYLAFSTCVARSECSGRT